MRVFVKKILDNEKVKVSHTVVSNSLCSHGLLAYPALSVEFSRQEYWSGLPFPSLGDLPDPGIEPGSPALEADSFYQLSHEGSPTR